MRVRPGVLRIQRDQITMRLIIFYDAWAVPAANDNHGGDGKRAKRHSYWN